METIITNILAVTNDINLKFRTSAYPIFIKKIIARRRRKKIISTIEKIHNFSVVDFSLISDYINNIFFRYSPYGRYGRYRSCFKIEQIENGNGELCALFKFPINEENNQYGTVALSPIGGTYLMRFVWNDDVNAKFAFSEDNVLFLENTKSYETSYPYSAKIENTVIKDCFVKALLDDIYEYLLSAVKSSERVTEYDRIKIKQIY